MEPLKTLLRWVIAGIGFGLGAMLVLQSARWLERRGTSHQVRVDRPAQVSLHDITPVAFSEKLVLTGRLENAGPTVFEGGYLRITLVKDGKTLYTCGEGLHSDVSAGTAQVFQVACRDLRTTAVPDGMRYEGEVLRAGFRTD